MSKNQSLEDSVSNWVRSVGYPLEMRAAAIFRSAGFEVRQAQHYVDVDSGKSREIDLQCVADDQLGVACIRIIAECKTSNKPWVVFTSENVLSGYNRLMALGLLSKCARGALAEQIIDLNKRLNWFAKDGRIGYAAAVAFSDVNEVPFAAVMGALKACLWEHNRDDGSFKPPLIATFPIVIVDAPLFECYLDGTDLRVARVRQCHLFYGGTMGEHPGTCVRIVTFDGLDDFAREAKAELSNLKSVLQPAIDEEWKALTARTAPHHPTSNSG